MTRRTSIYLEQFAHKNPVPVACRIGNIVYSSSIHGLNMATDTVADGFAAQCALMFSHVKAAITAAGGTPDDIVKMTLWMKDRGDRDIVNEHWLALFPDPASRPSRHALKAELGAGILIQCDFIAVLES